MTDDAGLCWCLTGLAVHPVESRPEGVRHDQGVVQSVELLLDAALDATVREQWRRLADVAHVTLARRLTRDAMPAALQALAPFGKAAGRAVSLRRWDFGRRRSWVVCSAEVAVGKNTDRPTRAELLARYRQLVMHELPRMAREQGWVIRDNHCFGRVVLDVAVGGCWYEVLDRARSPAFERLDDEALGRAVALAERMEAEGDPIVRALNTRSLAWRGKGRT